MSTNIIDKIMEQAQVFASAWALVGGRFDSGASIEEADAAKHSLQKMIEEALAKPQQEPFEVKWPEYNEQAMGSGLEDRGEHCRYGAMQYGWDCAIEAVAGALPDVIYTLEEALAKPKQEPAAWTWDTKNQLDGFLDAHFQFSKPQISSQILNLRPLYTSPPQRQWVGLTDDERVDL